MGAKLKSKIHLLNTFWFFEPFLLVWFQSFKKIAIMAWKKFKAKQVWRKWVEGKKVHISVTFLLITFLGGIFKKLFQRIRNQLIICVFWILQQKNVHKGLLRQVAQCTIAHINKYQRFLLCSGGGVVIAARCAYWRAQRAGSAALSPAGGQPC